MKTHRIDTTKKYKHYGEKIKQVQFHPTQPLLLAAQFNGKITVFNYELQTINKQIDVSEAPLRTAIWLPDDKILTAGDDFNIRIFSYHTTQKLIQFKAHNDFIRRVIYNTQTKELISCSDEKNIILWEFDEKQNTYSKKNEWKEHSHFVMDMKLNPKEEGFFTSCSLDKSIKIWNTKSDQSNGTLKGHNAGVNCISFYFQEKYLLISGADDFQVIIWDFSSRTQLRTLKHHNGNVMDVTFINKMPFFSSISEDGYLNMYSLKNYEYSFDVVNFMNKGWSLTAKNNLIAAAYDEGCVVIQLGNDKPISSTSKGKLVWTTNGEVFQINLKALVTQNLQDFEQINGNIKDLGLLQIFPKFVQHNENGQFVCFFDSQEFYIYKSLSFKLLLFGEAKEFCWGSKERFATLNDMNELVIQTTSGEIIKNLNFDFYIENIFGGQYLGISGNEFILFYDWDGENLLGKIDVEIQDIYWNKNDFFLKANKQSFMLRLNQQSEEPFDILFESQEQIYHGLWYNDFFFFVDTSNKLKIYIEDKSFTITNFKTSQIISDYLKNHEKFFFFDNSSKITTFGFSKLLMDILGKHFQDLNNIESEKLIESSQRLNSFERDFISKILVNFDKKNIAYNIVANTRTKFELALELELLSEAISFCEELKEPIYWKKLGDFALLNGDFQIAQKSYLSCQDTNSLLMIACCLGQKQLLQQVAEMSLQQKHYSVAFLANLNLQNIQQCIEILVETQKFSLALIFCKNYSPSNIESVFQQWKQHLINKEILLGKKIANPLEFNEDYPGLKTLIEIDEKITKLIYGIDIPSQKFQQWEDKLQELDLYQYVCENNVDKLEEHLKEELEILKNEN